jgi:hypothetical protein
LQEFQKESTRFQDKARADNEKLNKKIDFVQQLMHDEMVQTVNGVVI